MIQQLRRYYYRHQEKNIHALKYALAFAIGYLILPLLPDKNPVWILITIAVVMGSQTIVGQQVLRGTMRLIGTILGAILGVLTIKYISNPVATLFILVLTAFLFSKFSSSRGADVNYVAVLGMVTFSLIVFTPNSTVHYAQTRVIEIFIGILIALIVSRFIFPLNSRRAIIFELIRGLGYLSNFIDKVFLQKIDRRNNPDVNQLESSIVKSLVKLREIIRSGRYETIRPYKVKQQFNLLIGNLRSIYHYFLFVDKALYELSIETADGALKLREALVPTMRTLIEMFSRFAIEKSVIITKKDFDNFAAHFNVIKSIEMIETENTKEQLGVINFSLRQIPLCLEKLSESWNKIVN